MTRKELEEMICEEMRVPQCPEIVQKQIRRFTTELKYSYLEIAQALSFLITFKNEKLNPTYGIWKVPQVMAESKRYFAKKEQEKQKQIEDAQKAKGTIKITIECEIPVTARKRRYIDIDKL